MKNLNLPITSREYKLMLNVTLFKERELGVHEFWKLVESLAIRQGARIIKSDNGRKLYKEEQKKTYYLDTASQELKRNGFIVRVREEEKKGIKEYKLTLKYRSEDRYLSASQNLSVDPLDILEIKKDLKEKFEEDIIPPFKSKFSRSISLKSETEFDLDTIGQLASIFTNLKELNISSNQKLGIVNNFIANEVTLKLNPKINFAPEINIDPIEPVFSFWYLLGTPGELPLVGEFSFDYASEKETDQEKLEKFPLTFVQGANQWFASIQQQVNWLNFNSTTKTAYAYEGFATKNF